ncbi:MAG TPA: hypothetical protein VGK19_01705 [Capsulimonadaceae bacterium]|jgi:acyl carrier protein
MENQQLPNDHFLPDDEFGVFFFSDDLVSVELIMAIEELLGISIETDEVEEWFSWPLVNVIDQILDMAALKKHWPPSVG